MTSYSDIHIPTRAAIVDRARDLHASAIRLQDAPTARQLDRLIANAPAAGLCWVLGALHIESKSGGAYRVTRGGCSCPNGQLGRWQCWHIAMFHLLLEMLDTEAETRDMEADMQCDPPGDNPLGDDEGDTLPSALWARVATARACVWGM